MIGDISPEDVTVFTDRWDLNLSEFGALFGVTAATAYAWETGRRRPHQFTAELIKLGLRVPEERANGLELDKVILHRGAIHAFALYMRIISTEVLGQ